MMEKGIIATFDRFSADTFIEIDFADDKFQSTVPDKSLIMLVL